MNRKNEYRDMQRWHDTAMEQKARYYAARRYGSGRRRWTADETKIVMEHRMTDDEIARMIGRSVEAVQVHRCTVNKRGWREERYDPAETT